VPKGRAMALAAFADFVERAKASGLVRRTFDRNGFATADVAPTA
jgi:polar amino acid transport system substrate-binding protein